MADDSEQSFLELDPAKICKTADALSHRIDEAFPNSGLLRVSRALCGVADASAQNASELKRSFLPLRLLRWALMLAVPVIGLYGWLELEFDLHVHTLQELVDLLDPTIGSLVFMGALALFVWGLEDRWKREKVFRKLHELRSLAHVIDMHQLTKDPAGYRMSELLAEAGGGTEQGGKAPLTRQQLHIYLDLCSELLALIGKIGALYAQNQSETSTLEAADRVDALTLGLSRKIWQKMLVLESTTPGGQALDSDHLPGR